MILLIVISIATTGLASAKSVSNTKVKVLNVVKTIQTPNVVNSNLSIMKEGWYCKLAGIATKIEVRVIKIDPTYAEGIREILKAGGNAIFGNEKKN